MKIKEREIIYPFKFDINSKNNDIHIKLALNRFQ